MIPVESVAQLRKIENERLDPLDAKLDQVIDCPPFIVAANGQTTDQHDMRTVVSAAETKARLSARRANLNGLDVPATTITDQKRSDEIDRRMRIVLAHEGRYRVGRIRER